jgi:hypothetical protein
MVSGSSIQRTFGGTLGPSPPFPLRSGGGSDTSGAEEQQSDICFRLGGNLRQHLPQPTSQHGTLAL